MFKCIQQHIHELEPKANYIYLILKFRLGFEFRKNLESHPEL